MVLCQQGTCTGLREKSGTWVAYGCGCATLTCTRSEAGCEPTWGGVGMWMRRMEARAVATGPQADPGAARRVIRMRRMLSRTCSAQSGVPRPWTGIPSRSAAALRSTDAQLWAALGSGALTIVTMAWRGAGAGLVWRVAGEEVEYAVRARSALAQM